MRTFFGKGVAATVLALALTASAPALAAGDIAIGTAAPQIAAVDQAGAARNLENLATDKGVILLFTRSLQW